MVHISPERLRTVTAKVLAATGAPRESAEIVAYSLVENNLMGHDSHGVLRISQYTTEIASGVINPHGHITLVRSSAATALMDGGRNFGQLVARQAMELAMERARQHDLGLVAIRNCGHTGRLGEYACQAAEQGFIGLVFSSGSAPGGIVAPFGATSRALNTNPIAWAVPTGSRPTLFLDMATSIVAQGKIVAAIDNHKLVPDGWRERSGQADEVPATSARACCYWALGSALRNDRDDRRRTDGIGKPCAFANYQPLSLRCMSKPSSRWKRLKDGR